MNDTQDFTIKNGILTRYDGPGGDVTVPVGVTGIGKSAFFNRADLTSAVLPDGIVKIGIAAFFGCTGLAREILPDGVAEIGASAFNGCPDLTIHAPAGSYAETFAGQHRSINFIPSCGEQIGTGGVSHA